MSRTREEKLRYNKERAAFLKEHNMCAWCGKEKALENRRLCWDCAEKSAENSAKRRRCMTPNEKHVRNAERNERLRNRRQKLREAGLCTSCGKRKPADGKVQCKLCRNRHNTIARERRRRQGVISFDERGNGVYCLRCCKPVETEGEKFCTSCYSKQVQKAEHMRKFQKITPSWRADNDRVFRKRL